MDKVLRSKQTTDGIFGFNHLAPQFAIREALYKQINSENITIDTIINKNDEICYYIKYTPSQQKISDAMEDYIRVTDRAIYLCEQYQKEVKFNYDIENFQFPLDSILLQQFQHTFDWGVALNSMEAEVNIHLWDTPIEDLCFDCYVQQELAIEFLTKRLEKLQEHLTLKTGFDFDTYTGYFVNPDSRTLDVSIHNY